MKTIKSIILALSVGFFASCEKELDLQPQQSEDASITLSTEAGISNVLVGAYAHASNGDIYGGRILVAGDLMAQTGVTGSTELRWQGTFAAFRQMYNKTLLVNNGFAEAIYRRQYQIVNAANLVIENISKVSDPARRNVMIGEANFLKSLAYFDLVRFYAKPFVAGQANTQLGIVLRDNAITDYTIDQSKERSTVDAVYNTIIAGLTTAVANLPATNSIYADKYSAQALLARVYLQQGRFALARDAANDVIANSGHSLFTKYADAFNHEADGVEDVFTIQITKQTGDNQATNHYASESNGGRGGDVVIRNPYLARFNDPADERRNFNYINPENSRRLTNKFKNQFGDVGIIRLAEMYLIRAECNERLTTAVGATPLADINRLRARAVATTYTTVTLAQILLERELELGMEGFRIHDIKRTEGSITGSAVWAWNSDKLVFPIPQRETDTNKLITQNAGY